MVTLHSVHGYFKGFIITQKIFLDGTKRSRSICLFGEPIWAQKRFRFILASPVACYHMIRQIMTKFCFILTVNGSWSPWSSWQACSATCGDGIQMRTRVCKSPEPTNGGYSCEGENVDVKPCTVRRCRKYSGCFFKWRFRDLPGLIGLKALPIHKNYCLTHKYR